MDEPIGNKARKTKQSNTNNGSVFRRFTRMFGRNPPTNSNTGGRKQKTRKNKGRKTQKKITK